MTRFRPKFKKDRKFFTKTKERIKSINLHNYVPRGGIRL